MVDPIFFESWAGLLRTLFVGSTAYILLILLLRASGKRTLSKMNAFDLIITVALGSTLATVLLDKNVPLAEGITALALLIYLQWAITWGSVRSDRFQEVVKAEPTLLVKDGRYLEQAMRRQRVSEEEILAAVRQSGKADMSAIDMVVLETDGSLSVIPR
ncbi:YetF domain-containing protein [Chelativorans sp. AA-79]|uniref:DUF421 domain-containing protein n=1 Tax=Chelativorans sp. AA-79 TaxID=3028735 RepID=UPI0023F6DCF2|nr:YetF domain-containing protein [Chelativorans sp. AA-79]WEX07506.1 DUF421 domain-containing protein [Chelativorans sp. AA-79]